MPGEKKKTDAKAGKPASKVPSKKAPHSRQGTKKTTKKAAEKVKEKAVKEQSTAKTSVTKEIKMPEKKAEKKKPVDKEKQLAAHGILKFPLITEKAVNMIEAENKMVFIVNQNAVKGEIKRAVELLYGVEVDGVNIIRDMKTRKKAIVKISKKYKADAIATKLGVL